MIVLDVKEGAAFDEKAADGVVSLERGPVKRGVALVVGAVDRLTLI